MIDARAILIGVPIALIVAAFILYSKVNAEIKMCEVYYSEVSTWDCYWMPKTLPVRSSR